MSLDGTPHRNGTTPGLLSTFPQADDSNYAAVILAGGDGLRLSSFTRKVFGYHLPKQFCPLFEGETLLDRTMRRVSLVVPPAQTLTVLNRAHERFYSPLLGATASSRLLVEPANRGTAAAILCALRRLIDSEHTGSVAIFPSDHYVSDDSTFMRHVSAAFRAVDLGPRLTVLLGITPDGPETEYGWIEPGAPVAATHSVLGQINQVRRFWEKPSSEVARDLHRGNCLWNSFVLVGNTLNLLSLIASALPEMYGEFARVDSFSDGASEEENLRTIFRDLPSVDFSRSVLAGFPEEFSVLPVTGVTGATSAIQDAWSQLSRPATVAFRGKPKMSMSANRVRLQAVRNKSAGTLRPRVGGEIFEGPDPREFPIASSLPSLPASIRDEMLDLYAFLFCQGGFRHLGMTFEQFLLVIAAIAPSELSAQ